MSLSELLSGIVDFLYPERCVNCGAFGMVLCVFCEAGVSPATEGPRCPMCSARWDDAAGGGPGAGPAVALNCPRCLHMDAVERVHAAVDMEGAARRVVHALKYRGIERVAPIMARAIAPLTEVHPVDVVFAVPLHRSRQRQRGFNQSESILGSMLQGLGRDRPAGRLLRTKNTNRQVGMHLGERRSNISGAFDYSGPSLAGQTVGVLDDVVTTGATANECARVLRDHGARRVIVFAYARANYNPATPNAPVFD